MTYCVRPYAHEEHTWNSNEEGEITCPGISQTLEDMMRAVITRMETAEQERDALLEKQSRGWAYGICGKHGMLAMRRTKRGGRYYCPICRQLMPQDVLWTPDKIAELRERAEKRYA